MLSASHTSHYWGIPSVRVRVRVPCCRMFRTSSSRRVECFALPMRLITGECLALPVILAVECFALPVKKVECCTLPMRLIRSSACINDYRQSSGSMITALRGIDERLSYSRRGPNREVPKDGPSLRRSGQAVVQRPRIM